MLPNGGNRPPLSMSDINGPSGFNGLGNDLNVYRGYLFYRPDNSTGYFPSGAISFTDFYSTQRYSPVVPGSATYTSGSSITLPALFNTLTVTCYGGSGGGGGGSWLTGTTITNGGGAGGTGGTTTFAAGQSYAVSASGGGGGGGASYSYVNQLLSGGVWYNVASGSGTGAAGSDASGADSGSPAVGSSGSGAADSNSHTYNTSGTTRTIYSAANGGAGGKGGKSSILVFNIATQGWAYVSRFYNASIPVSFGSGGSAGSGGGGYAGLSGGTGGSGKILLSWT